MIVCICNSVSDKEIKEMMNFTAIQSIDDLQCIIKVCDQCSLCKTEIESILGNVETVGEKLRRESRKV